MKAVSGTVMRSLDRRAIEEAGIPGERLMKIAGALATSAIMEYISKLMKFDVFPRNIIVLAGKGNNAGDAFVVAKLMANLSEYNVFLHCVAAEEELQGDALAMFKELPDKIKGRITYGLQKSDLEIPNVLIVDGLLGTGFHGELREPFASWIRLVNESGHPVVSLDIPSGLNADTGEISGDAVTADLTVTMALPKAGMLSEEGIRRCGRIKVADIGIPPRYVEEVTEYTECTVEADVRKYLPREAFDIHKNLRGHLLVIGGSRLYSGAPALAGEAALRTSAGLVTVAIPESAHLFANPPKAMIVRKIPDSCLGFFCEDSRTGIGELLEKADAVVIGPGMGTDSNTLSVLEQVLTSGKRVLADADALNLLAGNPELAEKINADAVFTPHPGEMKRLAEAFGIDAGQTRIEQAKALAARLRSTIVLKGAHTVVAGKDGSCAVNLSGCPALATAGSGDILSGMIGAFLANGRYTVFECARAAVFLHGYAAELAIPVGSRGLIADDLICFIPQTIRKVSVTA